MKQQPQLFWSEGVIAHSSICTPRQNLRCGSKALQLGTNIKHGEGRKAATLLSV